MNAASIVRKCPKCKKGTLDYRTPRGFFVKAFLFWLPIRRYRCSKCTKRSYIIGSASSRPASNSNMEIVD
jgi:hypothetical protein